MTSLHTMPTVLFVYLGLLGASGLIAVLYACLYAPEIRRTRGLRAFAIVGAIATFGFVTWKLDQDRKDYALEGFFIESCQSGKAARLRDLAKYVAEGPAEKYEPGWSPLERMDFCMQRGYISKIEYEEAILAGVVNRAAREKGQR